MLLDVVDSTVEVSWIFIIPVLILLIGIGVKLTLLIRGIDHADKIYTEKEEAAKRKMRHHKNKKSSKNKSSKTSKKHYKH